MQSDKDTNNTAPVEIVQETHDKQDDNLQEASNNEVTKRKFFKFLLKHWNWLIIILLILTAFGIHYYNKRKLQQFMLEAKVKEQQFIAKTHTQLRENRFADVKNTVMVLSWAVRGELLRKNLDQVGQYLEIIVKYKGYEDVIVANEQDIIVLSTNKKYESMNLRDYFLFNYIDLKDITTIPDVSNPDHLFIIVPIMGMNSRIGTLMVSYKYAS